MTIDRISKCLTCNELEFVNREGYCEYCIPTATWMPSAGFMQAATPPAKDDGETEAV